MKYIKEKRKYFIYILTILHLYFLTFLEMKYNSGKLLTLKRNTLIYEIYFKYTCELEHKYIKLDSLL